MAELRDIIEPMEGRLAILVATKDEMIGGIYVPIEVARSIHEVRPTQGEIIRIGGEDLEDPPHDLKVGDIVVFGKYSGTEIKWQPDRTKPAQRVIILMFKDILCRLNVPEESANLTVKG